MKIIFSKDVGFCFGVKRAYKLSVDALVSGPCPCYMLGYLVHSEEVIKRLTKKGLKFVSSLRGIKNGTVVIRAHGAPPEVFKKLKEKKIKTVDATCTLVKKVQNIAHQLRQDGYQVIIIGDKGHAEVISIQGAASKEAIIIEKESDILSMPNNLKPLGVVAQTTQSFEKVDSILRKLKKKYKKVKFCNTLCPFVLSRQKEIKKMSKKTDIILVIGSQRSANTKRLVSIAKENKAVVFHVENCSQIKPQWFKNVKKVGIASGTSAPDWLIEEVAQKIKIITS